ncbi:hypothetical protein [Spongiactinospora sp. TRM90649]|uniref:hypothetical protein n=1 Tax=Spongiactinospora sp. TRM90649 TaxID=3031114 RepID=UPI0023FA0288|nr:hypothetical protein [Spongiactinospora sp. TRM90649]MDF5752967.1 hypothetical protein [Spongiactinospora sp. TRM90649]
MNPPEQSRPPRLATGLLIAFVVLGVVGLVIVGAMYWNATRGPGEDGEPARSQPAQTESLHSQRTLFEAEGTATIQGRDVHLRALR